MARVSRQLLSQSAKDYVRRAVASGEFPGDTRVSIDCLVKELDISPTPIREGLVQLVAEGFLRQLPNRGFHVLPLTQREVSELYSIGAALEDFALRNSPIPSADRLAELICLNDGMDDCPDGDPEALILHNQAWHRLLLEGCDNRQLFPMIAHLRARTFRYEYVGYDFDHTEMLAQIAMHREILDALEAGDLDGSRAVLRRHWRENLELLVRIGKSVLMKRDDH